MTVQLVFMVNLLAFIVETKYF